VTSSVEGMVERVRLASYAWVERGDAVLLCRISASDLGGGHWSLPGGGLDFGEEPEVGVLRELREETGLSGTVGELLGIRSAVLEPPETKRGDRIQNVGLLYRVAAHEGELVMEVGGSTDLAAWIPIAELDTLPLVPHVAWARERAGR